MDSEDVLTLDYAYSEAFAFLAGSHVAQLLKRLAGPISLSVESYSLRQAILAYAAAFNPSTALTTNLCSGIIQTLQRPFSKLSRLQDPLMKVTFCQPVSPSISPVSRGGLTLNGSVFMRNLSNQS